VDEAVTVACAVLGLLIGSFLNVVVARVPAGQSVVSPPSRCPSCGAPIAARDNIPVLSWLLLRGRARCCGTRISLRYPLVEVATAVAFGATGHWVAGNVASPDWPLRGHGLAHPAALTALLAMLYLAGAGLALALIDAVELDHRAITIAWHRKWPDRPDWEAGPDALRYPGLDDINNPADANLDLHEHDTTN